MLVVSKTFGIMKAMDLIPNHLRDRLGVKKVSLAYVIRDEEEVPQKCNLWKLTGLHQMDMNH